MAPGPIVSGPKTIANRRTGRKGETRVKPAWYADGLRFSCTQCGNCCSGDPGYVWATREEIAKIAAFLGRPDGWLDPAHLRRVGLRYSLTEKPDGDCIFLSREGGKSACTIYPVRPLQCRTWPFWPENLESAGAWQKTGKKCPGLNHGSHYTFVQIETIRKQKA
jgi:Fe-S-cluster containining protein